MVLQKSCTMILHMEILCKNSAACTCKLQDFLHDCSRFFQCSCTIVQDSSNVLVRSCTILQESHHFSCNLILAKLANLPRSQESTVKVLRTQKLHHFTYWKQRVMECFCCHIKASVDVLGSHGS